MKPPTFEQGSFAGIEGGNVIAVDERVLTEVDHLVAARTGPNHFVEESLADVRKNLRTAVQEAAQPYAVTEIEHEVAFDPETERRTFMWLGRTAVENAMSGYKYHRHFNARRRVGVEVDEARFAGDEMRPGYAYVFESPKMSRKDASLKDAQREHLGDDDAVRVSWLKTDPETGRVTGRVMQSLLVHDIPLPAWVNMLKDPNNIYGKSIEVEDEESALSVMKVYRELVVPLEKLPHGPITIVEEAIKYIDDPELRLKAAEQALRYYEDQTIMQEQAEVKADRWLEFECELAESLVTRRATSEIKSFIATMQHEWGSDELDLLAEHSLGGGFEFRMTRQLAVVLEKLKRNTLWGGQAVLSGDETVLEQLDPRLAQRIKDNEELIFMGQREGWNTRQLEAENARLIADAGIAVGRGCSGEEARRKDKSKDPDNQQKLFEDNDPDNRSSGEDDWKSNPNGRKWKTGICIIKSCFTRPGATKVGPCSICVGCQHKFDKGEDPTKEPTTPLREVINNALNELELFANSQNEQSQEAAVAEQVDAMFDERTVTAIEDEEKKLKAQEVEELAGV